MSGRFPSRLLRFFLITAVAIIVLSTLWSLVESRYNRVLADVTSGLVADEITVKEDKGTIYFLRMVTSGGLPTVETAWIEGSAIHFGLILAVALISATPGLRLRQRFLFMGIAAVVMFALHIATVLVMAKIVQYRGTSGLENDPLQILFVVLGTDLFPALLWAVFSLRYWFPRPGISSSPTR